jgi:hypothetical protein
MKAECKEIYHVEVSNTFAALEDLDTEVDINTAWETIRENIKIKFQCEEQTYEFICLFVF